MSREQAVMLTPAERAMLFSLVSEEIATGNYAGNEQQYRARQQRLLVKLSSFTPNGEKGPR